MDTINALILIAVIIVVFVICREIVCWYWKLNKIVYYQEYQASLLKRILKELKKSGLSQGNEPETQTLEVAPGVTGKIIKPKNT